MSVLACGRGRGALKSFSLPGRFSNVDADASNVSANSAAKDVDVESKSIAQVARSSEFAPPRSKSGSGSQRTHAVSESLCSMKLMEARVTEIIDVSTVWAQVGE